MNSSDKQLLLDLLKLKVTYTDEDFNRVLQVLCNGKDDYFCRVVQMINEMDSLSKRSKVNIQTIDHCNEDKNVLKEIKNANPDKYEILLNIQQLLQSNKIFKNVEQLRGYVLQRVILPSKRMKRVEIVNTYVEHCIDCSNDILAEEILFLKNKMNSKADVSTFMNMANKIVKSRKETRY